MPKVGDFSDWYMKSRSLGGSIGGISLRKRNLFARFHAASKCAIQSCRSVQKLPIDPKDGHILLLGYERKVQLMTALDAPRRADILKAIAHPTRITILEILRRGEECVCRICPALEGSQPNTSKHLAIMKRAGPQITSKTARASIRPR